MLMPLPGLLVRFRSRIMPVLIGPPVLAFLPAITLGAFWLGGEGALVVVALGLPLMFALAGAFGNQPTGPARSLGRDSVTGLILRDGFDVVMNDVLRQTNASGLHSACFVVELDDYRELVDHHGQSAADLIAQINGERLIAALRGDDTVARIGDSRFAVCLKAVRHLDLELCIQLSGRIQSAIEVGVPLGGMSVYMTCSLGFCLHSRAPGSTATDWLAAAGAALSDAQGSGPSAIRAYSSEIGRKNQTRSDLRDEVAAALENGQIQPWYQPQISTDKIGRASCRERV